MKNLLYTLMCIGVLLFVSCDKDEANEVLEDSVVNDNSSEEIVSSDQLKVEQKLLAKIQKNGHEFKFIQIGKEGDIVIGHQVSENYTKNDQFATLLDDEKQTPFDLFISLTNKTIEVPAAIAATSKNGALELSGRKSSTKTAPIELLETGFSTMSKAACYDVGANKFRQVYCDAPVISTPTSIEFCDNGTWNTLHRSSFFDGKWRLLDDITTWTNVICGITRMQFLTDNNVVFQVDMGNGIWKYRWYTSNNKKRRVKRFRPYNTGKFRAFTKFF